MSLLAASERLATPPKDEQLRAAAPEEVIVAEGPRIRYGATGAAVGANRTA
jgi:hypothetical protein